MNEDYIWQYERFLQDLEMARNYAMPYRMAAIGHIARNPILENILPSLLYIRMVSFFNDGLTSYIDNKNFSMPKEKYRKDFNGRINFLGDNKLIKATDECHRIRERRNSIAHDSTSNATWDEIDKDLSILEEELRNLNLIGQRPSYEFYAERSAMRDSEEPNVLFEQDYCFGLKEDNKKRIKVPWTTKLFR